MPNNEQLLRTGIFLAVGYLCAGISVALLAGIPFWSSYLDVSYGFTTSLILISAVLGVLAGLGLMRYLLPRIGVKAMFEHDVLVLGIGLLFISLTLNEAMLALGIMITAGALTVFFYESFPAQARHASLGDISRLNLIGWILGPVLVVLILSVFSGFGTLILRLLFAHYIIIGFWTWIQRLALHFDYHNAPKAAQRLFDDYQYQLKVQGKVTHDHYVFSFPNANQDGGAGLSIEAERMAKLTGLSLNSETTQEQKDSQSSPAQGSEANKDSNKESNKDPTVEPAKAEDKTQESAKDDKNESNQSDNAKDSASAQSPERSTDSQDSNKESQLSQDKESPELAKAPEESTVGKLFK